MCNFITWFIFNLPRRLIYSISALLYKIYSNKICAFKLQTSPYLEWWPYAQDANSPPFKSMLQFNYPFFKPLAPPQPQFPWFTPWSHIPHTHVTPFRQLEDNIGTSEFFLIRYNILSVPTLECECTYGCNTHECQKQAELGITSVVRWKVRYSLICSSVVCFFFQMST